MESVPPERVGAARSLNHARLWDLVVFLVAAVLYARTVGFGWVYDDQMEIVLNPMIRSLSHLPEIFGSTVWAGSGMETYLYRPLALVTYALNHLVSGLSPWSYHLVNVLLHGGASVLVFRVGVHWGLPLAAAGLGGLVFAVHPVHVEVVAAVFGRKDLLAGFFALAMVLLHPYALNRGGWRTALPVVAYALAMLSKEVGVVGIGLVAAQDWFLARDRSALFRDARRAGLYVAYVATLLAYVLVRNAVTGGIGVPETFYFDNPVVGVDPGIRWATALVVLVKGLLLQILPLTLSPDYSFNAIPLVRSPLDRRFLLSLLPLVAAATATWVLVKRRGDAGSDQETSDSLQDTGRGSARASRVSVEGLAHHPGVLSLGVAWYLIAILPASNFLVTVGTIFGERLLYLPSAAFSILAGWGLASLAGGRSGTRRTRAESDRPRPPLSILAGISGAIWIGFLALRTTTYIGAWDHDIALFRHAVASVPNSTKAHHKLGEELLRAGEVGAALPHLRRALEIAPDNQFAAGTLNNAREWLRRQYLGGESPDTPRPLPPSDPEILYTLGLLSWEEGDTATAGRFWEEAVEIDPSHALAQGDLGSLRLVQGDTASALRHLERAAELDPRLPSVWYGLGRIHLAQGRTEEARAALRNLIDAAGDRFPSWVRWARNALASLP